MRQMMKRGAQPVLAASRCMLPAGGAAIRCLSTRKPLQPNDVVVLSSARTPTGSFNGSLSSFTAAELGGLAIAEALKRADVAKDEVDEVVVGQAVQAGSKQGPARQAAIKAGLPWTTICSTVNKLCASSLKATMLASQAILAGQQDVMVAAGQENMSSIPYLLMQMRYGGYRMGHAPVFDAMMHDGLLDPWTNLLMGQCADALAKAENVSRADQDAYAIESYRRAMAAYKAGHLQKEILPVELKGNRKGGAKKVLDMDESVAKFDAKKIPTLKPVFSKDGTVTAANASSLNDAGSALVLTSYKWAQEHGKKPLAVVRSFADAEQKSTDFLTSPALAIPKAAKRIGLTVQDLEVFEINEAFAVAVLVCAKMMKIDLAKVNVNGGAVVLGHPVGSSGTRIIGALMHVLQQQDKTIGAAGVCNGGGGASAIVLERLN